MIPFEQRVYIYQLLVLLDHMTTQGYEVLDLSSVKYGADVFVVEANYSSSKATGPMKTQKFKEIFEKYMGRSIESIND